MVIESPFLVQIFTNTYPYVKKGEVGSYAALEATPRHNAVGSWNIKLNRSDQAAVELARPDRRITIDYHGTQVMSGEVSGIRRTQTGKLALTEVYGLDDKQWLARRLGYPNPLATFPADGTSFTQSVLGDTATATAETIIKSWVTRNAVTRHPIAGLVVAASQSRGATRTDQTRWETLLEAGIRVATAADLGLSMKQVGDHLVFDVYEPEEQPVRLSENLENLDAWEYVLEAPTATRLVLGLDGEGVARKYMQKKLTASETGWLATEKFEDVTDATTDPVASARGAELLAQYAPQAGFSITPRDTEAMTYGIHYNLGDKVQVEVASDTFLPDIVSQVVLSHVAGAAPRATPTVGNADAANKSSALVRRLLLATQRILRQERSR